MTAPLPCQRSLFDIPRDTVWMNAAYMAPLPRLATEAGQRGVARKATPWTLQPADFFPDTERMRSLFGQIIGADPECVAVIPAASYGIAVAARNLPLSQGQRIVVMEEQFPSNIYSWRRLAADAGGEVVTAPRDGAGGITGPLLEAITPQTGIVACAAAHWADGTAVDLVAVAERCREVGAALVLDLCQSAGAMPLDLGAVDPDFLIAPCYKWLLGPYQTGLMYVAPRHHDGEPIEESWLNREGAEDFAGLVNYTDAYRAGARRFDVGQSPNFALLPAAIASLELIAEWTPPRIAERLTAVNDRLSAALVERGFSAPASENRAPHFFGVGLPASAPADLAARLAAERVHVSVRGTKMRIAPHVWIDGEDEARFLAAVEQCLG